MGAVSEIVNGKKKFLWISASPSAGTSFARVTMGLTFLGARHHWEIIICGGNVYDG
jgi:hypothetical protein